MVDLSTPSLFKDFYFVIFIYLAALGLSCSHWDQFLWWSKWLRLPAPNAGGPGSFAGQETSSFMPQLRLSTIK